MSVLTAVAGALRYGGGCDLLNSNAQVRQPAAVTSCMCGGRNLVSISVV
jgi:hypothetical protein